MTQLSTAKSNDRPKHEPHEEGTFAAICVDNFTITKPNPYKGQVNKWDTSKIDNRDTVTKVCIAFMTTETIVMDGVEKPRYTSFWAPMTWHEKSKLRQAIAKWMPAFAMNDTVDLDDLIGKPCMVSVEQYPKTFNGKPTGEIGDSVIAIVPLPKGMEAMVPKIPADFERHKDREALKAAEAGGQAPVAAPVAQVPAENDDLPF